LFVLFDLGFAAGSHKTLLKIENLPFPTAANEENPCPKRRPHRTEFLAFTHPS
jgi:hypothetical protein